ncbi:MAG: hypothetical protein GX610_07145 [Rhodococcus sp.]|nr:hypothetical protein [Rhodococcus sp. (in: high G+C Gram-positive bacteria)]
MDEIVSEAKTYRDFEWVVSEYPWVENGLFVTYVRDADPTTVIEAMTVEDLGTAEGLSGVNELGWQEPSIIGAAALGEWTIAIAPMAIAGVSDELMRPLSVGREVLTHSEDVESDASFLVWKDGESAVYFDPLLRCGYGLDPMPAAWKTRMREVGIDPDEEGPLPDGEFHVTEGSFAMAANYTGTSITPEFLSAATFFIGNTD